MSRRLGFIYLLARVSYDKTAIPLANQLPGCALVPLQFRLSEPSFCRHPYTYPLRSDPTPDTNLARGDATSSFFHVVLRLRRLVESSREEIRKSWKAEYRGRERRKIRGLRRKEKLVSRIEKLTTRECESLLFGKLCLPVFPEEAFLLPRPLTRYSFPSLSLSLSFFPLAIPEKYFSSRTFSRVYAIPRSMRGMGEEEEGKEISAERRSRVKRAGRARNVCFFFSCLSRPPLSAKLSVEVSAHNQFMEHREATVLARARERKRERMEGG